MIKHGMKLAVCISVLGAAALANEARAMTLDECDRLPGNMYLAAIERGECDIDIQTAAGSDLMPIPEADKGRGRDGRNAGAASNSGGSNRGSGKSGPNGPNNP